MSVVFDLLLLIFAAASAFALVSFAFAWYEAANRNPSLLTNRFSLPALSLALSLVGMETFFLFLSVLLHPLGWYPRRDGEPAPDGNSPVLLLHGLFQSNGCWLCAMHRLRRRGFRNLYVVPLPPWKEMEALTERVARKVDELRSRHGIPKVHLVAHSMGGIIARNYLQFGGGASKVDRCVLLGAPNRGSKLVPFALSPLASLVMPGAEFLGRLAAAPAPQGVRLTAIYSRHDNIVLPYENARLEGAIQVELAGIGHTGLLFHHRAFDALAAALTEETP